MNSQGGTARDEMTRDALTRELVSVVQETMQPERVVAPSGEEVRRAVFRLRVKG